MAAKHFSVYPAGIELHRGCSHRGHSQDEYLGRAHLLLCRPPRSGRMGGSNDLRQASSSSLLPLTDIQPVDSSTDHHHHGHEHGSSCSHDHHHDHAHVHGHACSHAHHHRPSESPIAAVSIPDAIGTTRARLARNISESQRQRLKTRDSELLALQAFFVKHPRTHRFVGFNGWGDRGADIPPGLSQYDSFIFETLNEDEWVRSTLPLGSRISVTEKVKTDFFRETVSHGDHQHEVWSATPQTIAHMQARLIKTFKTQLSVDEEGCPCCTAGLDFDEFAAAINEVKSQQGSHDAERGLFSMAETDTSAHWGLFLGISGPFSLIGLAAAIRNVKGGINNYKKLSIIIKGLDQDIAENKHHNRDGVVARLLAFRKSLAYSKFDAAWNISVPGVLNGAASSLVLSTAVLASPLALGAIALYATAQAGRGVYDFSRTAKANTKISASAIAEANLTAIEAKKVNLGVQKAQEIKKHKKAFFATNAGLFTAFAAGAVLTLLGAPGIAVFGAGTPLFIAGLVLLGIGAAGTGIGNNIWPKKFRPRNAELSQRREDLDAVGVAKAIGQATQDKRIIKKWKSAIFGAKKGQKRLLKVKTALPEFKDFMPKKVANFFKKVFFFLPNTGSQATKAKHHLNQQWVRDKHQKDHKKGMLEAARQNIVKQYAANRGLRSSDHLDTVTGIWKQLTQLGLEKEFLENWIKEGFWKEPAVAKPHSHGHGHGHEHHDCGSCDDSSLAWKNIRGFNQESADWISFDAKVFERQASDQDKAKFWMALDYYLFFVLGKSRGYEERAWVDHLGLMPKQ